jgi:transcriptional regulator with XRE-family HTH domain
LPVTITVDELGAELRRRRDAEDMSLKAVEEQTSISAATLSRIENGRRPESAVIERLARWLGVNVVAAGARTSEVQTDEDLRRTIAVHLRANKNLPDSVTQAIVQGFDVVMRLEIERARTRET